MDSPQPSRLPVNHARRGLPLRAVAVGVTAALAACSSQRRPSLLLVTLDTVRADRLGCYGCDFAGTKTIDSVATCGVRFDQAFAQSPLTLPSHATIVTGLLPPTHRIRDNGAYSLAPEVMTLAEVLESAGYHTAAFTGAFVLDSGFGLAQGFQVYDDSLPSRGHAGVLQYAERRAGTVVDRAKAWLRRASAPFFLWVHLYDPHVPYDPPSPYDSLFVSDPYQGEIAYADAQVGRLLASIRDRGLAQTCVVVVVSDHGEALGEHGESTHGYFVYQETMRVPFVMAGPGLPGGVRISSQVRLADVAPTVLDLLAIPSPSELDGQSLLPVVDGTASGLPSYGETFYPCLSLGWSPLRSLRADGYTYIEAPTPELYHSEDDPGEVRNLAAVLTEQLHVMASRLDSMAGPLVPETAATASPGVARRLAALGYLSGGGTGAPRTGRDPKDALPLYNDLLAADVMIRRGAFDRAESLLQQVLSQDPANRQAMLHLGVLLKNRGRLREAAQVLDQGRDLYPGDYELTLQSGVCHRQLGDLQAARDRYQAALRLFDNDAVLFTNLGILEQQRGNREEARAAYTRALELDPNDATAHFNLGMLLVREGGDPAAALAHLDRAAILNPAFADRPNVAKIRAALRRVAGRG